jgi:hypothetical protein
MNIGRLSAVRDPASGLPSLAQDRIGYLQTTCADPTRTSPIGLEHLRTLALPEPIKDWSLTSLKEKLTKFGTKVVSHGPTSRFRWPRSPLREICSPTFR